MTGEIMIVKKISILLILVIICLLLLILILFYRNQFKYQHDKTTNEMINNQLHHNDNIDKPYYSFKQTHIYNNINDMSSLNSFHKLRNKYKELNGSSNIVILFEKGGHVDDRITYFGTLIVFDKMNCTVYNINYQSNKLQQHHHGVVDCMQLNFASKKLIDHDWHIPLVTEGCIDCGPYFIKINYMGHSFEFVYARLIDNIKTDMEANCNDNKPDICDDYKLLFNFILIYDHYFDYEDIVHRIGN